ncbi:peptide-methionine (R)-S-oxide reductase MsrB [Pontibacter sp. E15-1]|uniref:peptide-methionine (R)-S-oxide reductase MsrB n=1 Tax=Pontibacter sp. E15-1 TaxID=2919918 RepID=UPI001F4F14CF|nr:peptide-methionine (R)-S-oxide reductase MsrB [Pontibacter sp. E15-1]MCJ8163405.1 peptide-methionine (R)-S-oxide reductase MsrB [Pontibacter sp. E15-1]
MLRWKDIITYAKYGNPEPVHRLERTEEEWRRHLTPEQYAVTRLKGTERAYRNAFCRVYTPGAYACVGCGSVLFQASEKYNAISGWPSFTQPSSKGALKYAFDDSHKMHRIEAMCNVCDCHLGHVSHDGPAPHGLRYCINSASLVKLPPGLTPDCQDAETIR